MSTDVITVFINEMKNNVNGFIAVAIAEIETGLCFGSYSTKSDFDVELAAAYNIEVVKAKLAAVQNLGLAGNEIEDILITLTTQIHILDVSPNKKYMIYLSVDKSKANLGMTRGVLRKYKVELEEGLKG
jgi:hypothetical protein